MDGSDEQRATGDAGRLDRALATLVSAGTLTGEQAAQVRQTYDQTPGPTAERKPATASAAGRIPEVLGYLGGAFVVAAVLLVLGWSWDDFDYPTRVAVAVIGAAVTFGGGLLLAGAAGGGFRGLHDRAQSARRRLVGVLLVAGTWIFAGAVGLVVDHADVSHPAVWVAPVTVVLGLLAVRVAPGVLPTASLFGATVLTVFAVQDAVRETSDLVWVLVFLALGVVWVLLGPTVTRARQAALVVGLGLLVATAWVAAAHDLDEAGPYDPVVRTEWGEGVIRPLGMLTLVALTALGCAVYLRGGSWPWMAAGTLAAVALVVELTGDAYGPAVAALVAGMVLLAASGVLVLRRGRAERRAATTVLPTDPGP